jgi:hypothetical protein
VAIVGWLLGFRFERGGWCGRGSGSRIGIPQNGAALLARRQPEQSSQTGQHQPRRIHDGHHGKPSVDHSPKQLEVLLPQLSLHASQCRFDLFEVYVGNVWLV